ncbi:MAG: PEP-CTERM sorting domain-containing protein [Alphaproteobacteria bacterium]|nr:PEP-CTERM sorting domain-containing protein [Alphaproteobacteria bacterium]
MKYFAFIGVLVAGLTINNAHAVVLNFTGDCSVDCTGAATAKIQLAPLNEKEEASLKRNKFLILTLGAELDLLTENHDAALDLAILKTEELATDKQLQLDVIDKKEKIRVPNLTTLEDELNDLNENLRDAIRLRKQAFSLPESTLEELKFKTITLKKLAQEISNLTTLVDNKSAELGTAQSAADDARASEAAALQQIQEQIDRHAKTAKLSNLIRLAEIGAKEAEISDVSQDISNVQLGMVENFDYYSNFTPFAAGTANFLVDPGSLLLGEIPNPFDGALDLSLNGTVSGLDGNITSIDGDDFIFDFNPGQIFEFDFISAENGDWRLSLIFEDIATPADSGTQGVFNFGNNTVPEPGSLALFGLVLLGLGYTARRRKAA